MGLKSYITKRRLAWVGTVLAAAVAGYWHGSERSEQDQPTCAPARSSINDAAINITQPGPPGPPSPPGAGAAAATIQQARPATVAARINEMTDESERRLVRQARRAQNNGR